MPTAIAQTDTWITPPVNDKFVDLDTIDDGTLKLAGYGATSDKVKLRFQEVPGWQPVDTNVIIKLLSGWTLAPTLEPLSSPLAWSSAGNVWVAQVLTSVIKKALDGTPTTAHFTLIHVTSGRRLDPVIVVEREG